MNNISQRLAELSSEEKRELLKQLLEDTTQHPRSSPLSFAQQRMWFLHKFDPRSPAYNMPAAVRLSGRLNVAVLEQSLNEIIRRHEILRTRFDEVGGVPMQIISETQPLKLEVTEFRAENESEKELEAQRFIASESCRPFDLSRPPLMRVGLLRLGEEEHVVALTMHHIISDGWSLGRVIHEMGVLYQAFSLAKPSPLPELPLQYAEYAVWQRDWLRGEVLNSQLNYWRHQLDGVPPVQALPTARRRPRVPSAAGASETLRLPVDVVRGLRALSRSEGITLFMTLLAAFRTLLYRYTSQTDSVIGSPFAGRNRAQTEELIGLFVNTLALRTSLEGNPSFRELLQREKQTTLDAFAHQDLPFEKLIDELQLERDLSYSPLFQTMFVLQNAPQGRLELGDLKITNMNHAVSAVKFDLTFTVREQDEGLRGSLSYRKDLFDAENIKRLLVHYGELLRNVVENPHRRLSELSLMTAAEERQLLEKSNDPTVNFPQDACLHRLFERQAERTPDAVAVIYQEERLTYDVLNRRANQLAHHLRSLGVGVESRVGILLERSVEMVVALLGVLKAGAAYVPLDTQQPRERLAFMLKDAEVEILVTLEAMCGRLPSSDVRTICLDTHREQIAGEPATPPDGIRVLPENAAYIIYTSGSTGRPKGTVVTHANVVRLFAATRSWFNFDERDVWTLFHSYAFDFSVWELWGALLYGGRLVVVPYWVSRSPEAFHHLLAQERVTVLNQTPSAFYQFIHADESAGDGDRLALRLVIFGGEALDFQNLRRWFERHGDEQPRLVNMYGITETTVHVTYRPLTRADLEQESGSAIGRPLHDLRLYILDPQLRPVLVGARGELYVGGGGLARGYLNRASLTAERFLPDPFDKKGGSRLYRTGDLARYRSNGDIEYLGRCDQQVKIRGFRIEIGEVEAVLGGHQALREVLVTAVESTEGQRLIAYVVPHRGQQPVVAELSSYLRERLPEYMQPSAFVMMEGFPLTPNGKLDRRALPLPAADRTGVVTEYVAARNEVEAALCLIWQEVLGLAQVGIKDNFFALGGDSIRSVQVISKAQDKGIKCSILQIFENQTIDELSQKVAITEPSTPNAATKEFSLISEADRLKLASDVEDAYPLTALQMGMLYHSELSPESAVYHNIHSFHLKARVDTEALLNTLRESVSRHAVLRTSFDLQNFSQPLQLVQRRPHVPFAIEDIRHLSSDVQEEAIALAVEAEKQCPFDWTKAPLFRVHVHLRGQDSFQLTITEHHSILDGWSLSSWLAEIFHGYLSILDGVDYHHNAPLPASSFRDFVALERQSLNSEEAQQFWKKQLDGSTFTKLPRRAIDDERPAPGTVYRQRVPIPDATSQGLHELAGRAGVPLKSVLLAAHLRVLSFLGGEPDVTTGLVMHGRPEGGDSTQLLGLFLNTVPLRLKVAEGSWLDLVRAAFNAERQLLPFRYYPAAQIQREQGGQLLFESAFNFTNFHVLDSVRQVAGVEVLGFTGFAESNIPFWSNFSLDSSTSAISLTISGEADIFTPEQLANISCYYAKALFEMTAHPEARHHSVNLHSEAEEHTLSAWNETRRDCDAQTCLHRLFEEQVRQTPDASAVSFEDKQLTYSELNRKANQLAHYLRASGVNAEKRVCILMERSLDMVVALLAVLKAGGAHVPLDPAYPRQRLAFMLDDADATILLTHQRHVENLPQHSVRIIALDRDWPSIARHSTGNPESAVSSENLAYVIYTSGSTGQPKGVAITHRAITNHMHWMQETFPLDSTDCVLQKTPFSFDASVWEFYAPLLAGARLVLARPDGHKDASYLIETIVEHKVTTLQLVPSALRLLLTQPDLRRCESLRRVFCGGEELKAELPREVSAILSAKLYNLYGPTEATIDATYHTCGQDRQTVPLGRPIANTETYILNNHLQQLPVGVAGELYISGSGLARGYLNRPELTAARFVPNPFGTRVGERLYRTGDMARRLPNGELEFLGRRDYQLKLRGYRIEPGEIEAALLEHPHVREAVVTLRMDAIDDERLVAYIIWQSDSSVNPTDALRNYIRQKLPEYMQPSAYVLMEEFPLTPNGKLDRRALPAPAADRAGVATRYVAARNEVEAALCLIWQEVLGVPRVGVEDDFFELGGHSLLTTQVISRIRERLGAEVPLRALFEEARVGALAQSLAAGRWQRSTAPNDSPQQSRLDAFSMKASDTSTGDIKHSFDNVHSSQLSREQTPFQHSPAAGVHPAAPAYTSLVSLQPEGSNPAFFCIHPAGGHVLCYADLARALAPDQPFYALQAQGLNGQPLINSIEDMAAFYLKEIQSIQSEGPYMLGGWSMGGCVAFEMAQQLHRRGERVSLLALFDSISPLVSQGLVEDEDEASLILSFAYNIGLSPHLEGDANQPTADLDGQLEFILQQSKRYKILPANMDIAQLRQLFAVYTSNVRAIRNYQPETYAGRLTLFRATEQLTEDLNAPTGGWDALATGGVSLNFVSGNHYTLLQEPHVRGLTEQLSASINLTLESDRKADSTMKLCGFGGERF